MVGLCIGIAIFLLAMVGKVIEEGVSSGSELAMTITLAVFFLGMVAGLWYGRPRDGALWDLDHRTITSKGEQIPFEAIHRVIVHTGTRGYYGLAFVGTQGYLPRLAIPIWSKKSPAPDLWVAIRELIASPHTPTLEGYGVVRTSDRGLQRPPLSATNGPLAVRILDAQLAWLAQGGDQRSSQSPVEQFRLSRHLGP